MNNADPIGVKWKESVVGLFVIRLFEVLKV
jgi:hypothetical protein